MGNVLQFSSKTDKIKESMYEKIAKMEELYQTIDLAVTELLAAEKEADDVEREFNKQLRIYADSVGEENVEVGFLEYAPEIEVYLDDEGIPDIRFTNDPEQLELFPEEEQ
tara:strand:+ start:145 stop:474 length:330 start_codon:yes stop_codon:yes gene_type:complete